MRSICSSPRWRCSACCPWPCPRAWAVKPERPFASVIVGGMLVLPVVALVLLPVLYAWLGPKTLKKPDELDESP